MNKIILFMVGLFKALICYTPRNSDGAFGTLFLVPKLRNLLGEKDSILDDDYIQADSEDDYITYAVEQLHFKNDEVFALPIYMKNDRFIEFDLFHNGEDESIEFCGVMVIPKNEARAVLGVRELEDYHEDYIMDEVRGELDLLTECANEYFVQCKGGVIC